MKDLKAISKRARAYIFMQLLLPYLNNYYANTIRRQGNGPRAAISFRNVCSRNILAVYETFAVGAVGARGVVAVVRCLSIVQLTIYIMTVLRVTCVDDNMRLAI